MTSKEGVPFKSLRDHRAKLLAGHINRHPKRSYSKQHLMRMIGLRNKSLFKDHHIFANTIIAVQKFLPEGKEIVRFKCNKNRYSYRDKIPTNLSYSEV